MSFPPGGRAETDGGRGGGMEGGRVVSTIIYSGGLEQQICKLVSIEAGDIANGILKHDAKN